ncbi:MAG: hypothetical protein KC656_12650, partial [Myxococcales bacterium]|nr:hypothetical protein [Myxococcales bacterium]
RAVYEALDAGCREAAASGWDSRWVDLVLLWLARPPFRLSPEICVAMVGLLDRHADPRGLEVAREIAGLSDTAFRERYGGLAALVLPRWAERRAQSGYPAVTRPARALSEAEEAALADVEEALEAWQQDEEDRLGREASMLHAAAAGDDDALLVLADLLAARGDPRGEWLQIEALGDPRHRERRKALRKRPEQLLGDLGAVALQAGLRFRRGLPVSLTAVAPRPGDLERVLASPDWAPVERLELRAGRTGEVPVELVLAEHARRLVRVVVPDQDALEALLDLEGPAVPVETVEVLEPVSGRFVRRGPFTVLRTVEHPGGTLEVRTA